MILAINTNGKTHSLGLYEPNYLETEICWEVINTHRKDILVELKKFLQKNSIRLDQINKLIVYAGPGSHTSVRAGVTVANALGWILDVPVVSAKGVKYNDDLSALDIIMKNNKKLQTKTKKFTKIVNPYYPMLN